MNGHQPVIGIQSTLVDGGLVWPTPAMQRRHFLRATALAAVASVAGCTEDAQPDEATGEPDGSDTTASTDTDTTEPTTTEAGEDQKAVTILDHELVEDTAGFANVEGTVQNTSGEEQSYIQIEARYFDEEGTRIGESLDNATDVPAGQKLAFTCMGGAQYDEVDSYEVEAGTSL